MLNCQSEPPALPYRRWIVFQLGLKKIPGGKQSKKKIYKLFYHLILSFTKQVVCPAKSDHLSTPKLRREYLDAFSNTFISKTDFRSFYGEDDSNRVCTYCATSEQDFTLLISKRRLYSKRLSTRGRTMEVDRKHPNMPYRVENVVLCCYFCNNAKTDEFTFEEFEEMGKAFGHVWKNRLKAIQ
jgi:hypothetical protein